MIIFLIRSKFYVFILNSSQNKNKNWVKKAKTLEIQKIEKPLIKFPGYFFHKVVFLILREFHGLQDDPKICQPKKRDLRQKYFYKLFEKMYI